MENIHKISDKKLIWTQPRASRREFELRSGEGTFATLKWAKSFGSLASAVTAEGEWTFKRMGFLHPRVSIRTAGSENDFALFKPGWTGAGELEFATGLRMSWINKSFFGSQWVFADKTGDILRFKLKPGLVRLSVEVEVMRDLPESPVLASLGLYLLVLMQDDNAAVAAVVPVIA